MRGKKKCELLKSIRCKIAKQNGIDYTLSECTFQGECKGTCPKCEAELQYLANELEKIKQSGKRVAVAGIAAAMVATSATACTPKETDEWEALEYDYAGFSQELTEDIADYEIEGKIIAPEKEPYVLDGDVEYPEEE